MCPVTESEHTTSDLVPANGKRTNEDVDKLQQMGKVLGFDATGGIDHEIYIGLGVQVARGWN
jgi:hypothetical protein